MHLSVFDFFRIGIGPSSSHAVGPMRAAGRFLAALRDGGRFDQVQAVTVELFGSLALTGQGHGTDSAVLMGLEGAQPDTVDPDRIPTRVAEIRASRELRLADERPIAFDPATALLFHHDQVLPRHPNGMRFTAHDAGGTQLLSQEYFSIGGGFVVGGDDASDAMPTAGLRIPFPYTSARQLLRWADAQQSAISDIVLANETASRSASEVRAGLLAIWRAMQGCVARGLAAEGVLPGGLHVRRRAAGVYRSLQTADADPLRVLDWVDAWAMAVNEENAAGGRVVTAPTNGAAGVLPAVLHYYDKFVPGADEDGILRFLLTAGGLVQLYKRNASISGAEVGCQGEVGVASSIAAGGLTEVLGGTPAQVEQAAEIAMEHHLGMTCDPVGGLVQVPCIERNAMGAVKAINAARLALHSDGVHVVSLDRVIAVMRQTGADMSTRYKETSLAGLAVSIPDC